MYDQQKMHVTAEAKNPARIPAPTNVHRKRKVNSQVSGGFSFCTSSFKVFFNLFLFLNS